MPTSLIKMNYFSKTHKLPIKKIRIQKTCEVNKDILIYKNQILTQARQEKNAQDIV